MLALRSPSPSCPPPPPADRGGLRGLFMGLFRSASSRDRDDVSRARLDQASRPASTDSFSVSVNGQQGVLLGERVLVRIWQGGGEWGGVRHRNKQWCILAAARP